MSALLHRLPLGWMAKLALLRLAAQWRSLVTVMVGVFLAAIIGANAPLYTAAVAQLGMVQRVEQQPADKVNIFTRFGEAGEDADLASLWASADGEVRSQVAETLGSVQPDWVSQTLTWGESDLMFAVRDGADLPDTKLRVAYYDDWTTQVSVVEGRLPGDASDVDLEAAMLVDTAAALGIHAGDLITLDQRGWDTSVPVKTRITALIEPLDPSSAYWMQPSPLRIDVSGETNLLTDRASFLKVAQNFVPKTRTQIGWRILFDPTQLEYASIPTAVDHLNDFQASLTAQFKRQNLTPVYNSGLAAVLTQYQSEIGYLNAPFGLLLLQVGALVLFFLVVMVALVRRGERREIALLQSRGAVDRQIVLLRGVEALIICAAAALAAPFIARAILSWGAPLIAGVAHLPLRLDAAPFLYAAFAAALALLVLVAALRPVLRLPLILAGGSAARGEKQVWWQRYYLDVVLLVVGGAALFRLITTNSPLAQTALGGVQADPLLLIAPALLFVALGSVTLRLFPTLADAAARAFSRRRDLAGALATWQVSREPAHYGRITFLLAMAIGVGWFATSFQATVAASHLDQARYQVGADLRFGERDTALDADRVQPAEVYTAQPGVASATDALRLDGINFSISGTRTDPGTLLGVDPASFAQTAYWRGDLGDLALPSAPDLSQTGAALPITPQKIGLWLRVQQQVRRLVDGELVGSPIPVIDYAVSQMTFWVRLRDASGAYWIVPLTAVQVEGAPPDADLSQFRLNLNPFMDQASFQAEVDRLSMLTKDLSGWVYFEGALPATPQGETRLDMIYWRSIDQDAQFSAGSATGATSAHAHVERSHAIRRRRRVHAARHLRRRRLVKRAGRQSGRDFQHQRRAGQRSSGRAGGHVGAAARANPVRHRPELSRAGQHPGSPQPAVRRRQSPAGGRNFRPIRQPPAPALQCAGRDRLLPHPVRGSSAVRNRGSSRPALRAQSATGRGGLPK